MSSWRRLFVLSIVVVASAAALVVHAQVTAGDVITACVGPNGSLRVVSSPGACRPPEQLLSWGGGLSGYEIVTADYLFPTGTTSAFGSRSVQCPPGKKVLGGGASALANFPGGLVVVQTNALSFGSASYPSAVDTWTVAYDLSSAVVAVGFRMFATCAS